MRDVAPGGETRAGEAVERVVNMFPDDGSEDGGEGEAEELW